MIWGVVKRWKRLYYITPIWNFSCIFYQMIILFLSIFIIFNIIYTVFFSGNNILLHFYKHKYIFFIIIKISNWKMNHELFWIPMIIIVYRIIDQIYFLLKKISIDDFSWKFSGSTTEREISESCKAADSAPRSLRHREGFYSHYQRVN